MAVEILIADQRHLSYADAICQMIEDAAKQRGTGIAKREPTYVQQKIHEHKAIIALDGVNLVGFCYIETWQDTHYVANSGLIVNPAYRGQGVAKGIKKKAFEHSRNKFPHARLFGITTSLAVMRINSSLGYKPVTFTELTQDDVFWKGCESCPNYEILERNERKLCLCTGMMFDPAQEKQKAVEEEALKNRWESYKNHLRRRKGNQLLQKIKENLFSKESKGGKN
ncbi:MAG: GNAT family N-acetyltransferase [Bacteroidota bacterium]